MMVSATRAKVRYQVKDARVVPGDGYHIVAAGAREEAQKARRGGARITQVATKPKPFGREGGQGREGVIPDTRPPVPIPDERMSEGLIAVVKVNTMVVGADHGLEEANDVNRGITNVDARDLEAEVQTLDEHERGNVDMVAAARGERPRKGQLFMFRGGRGRQAPVRDEQKAAQLVGRACVGRGDLAPGLQIHMKNRLGQRHEAVRVVRVTPPTPLMDIDRPEVLIGVRDVFAAAVDAPRKANMLIKGLDKHASAATRRQSRGAGREEKLTVHGETRNFRHSAGGEHAPGRPCGMVVKSPNDVVQLVGADMEGAKCVQKTATPIQGPFLLRELRVVEVSEQEAAARVPV